MPGVTKDLSLAPFQLHGLEDGSFELLFFEMDEVEDVFEDLGAEANGHGWQALAEWVVHAKSPDIAALISFDSESGTFVAKSTDREALRGLAERLHAAFHSHSLLAQLIREAELD
jgi:hypothetical protein